MVSWAALEFGLANVLVSSPNQHQFDIKVSMWWGVPSRRIAKIMLLYILEIYSYAKLIVYNTNNQPNKKSTLFIPPPCGMYVCMCYAKFRVIRSTKPSETCVSLRAQHLQCKYVQSVYISFLVLCVSCFSPASAAATARTAATTSLPSSPAV